MLATKPNFGPIQFVETNSLLKLYSASSSSLLLCLYTMRLGVVLDICVGASVCLTLDNFK